LQSLFKYGVVLYCELNKLVQQFKQKSGALKFEIKKTATNKYAANRPLPGGEGVRRGGRMRLMRNREWLCIGKPVRC
jgi:hypothetical protein